MHFFNGLAFGVLVGLAIALFRVSMRSKNHSVVFYCGVGGLFSLVGAAFVLFLTAN